MVHLHLTILHHIQTQTTAVSLLQLITGKWHDVTNNIVLSVSPIITYRQVWLVDNLLGRALQFALFFYLFR